MYRKHDETVLAEAVEAVSSKSMSLRAAARQYKIPRTTLQEKVSGKTPVKIVPKTVLSVDEELQVVNRVLSMPQTGAYSKIVKEVLDLVKQIVEADNRPNPFKDNRPGKDWWHSFLKRHPKLSDWMSELRKNVP